MEQKVAVFTDAPAGNLANGRLLHVVLYQQCETTLSQANPNLQGLVELKDDVGMVVWAISKQMNDLRGDVLTEVLSSLPYTIRITNS